MNTVPIQRAAVPHQDAADSLERRRLCKGAEAEHW